MVLPRFRFKMFRIRNQGDGSFNRAFSIQASTQHPHKISGVASQTCQPSVGNTEAGGSRAHWPATLVNWGDSKIRGQIEG